MKAIITTQYGGPQVLQLAEVATPTPKENEVLIKIEATAITQASVMMRTGKPYFGRLFLGFKKPKNPIPGTDLAGTIVALGSAVKKFKIGDEVMAETGIKSSSYAEYITLAETEAIVLKPKNSTFEEATGMLDGAVTALSFFTDTIQIKQGQKVLINGASGGIGTAAVQLAKHFGAEVTGVCSAKNIDLVKSLGADHVIDYRNEDFTETKKNTYDIVFDTVGKVSVKKGKQALKPQGTFISPVMQLNVFAGMLQNICSKQKVKFAATGMRKVPLKIRDMQVLRDLIENNQFRTVIDKTYSLAKAAEAQMYVEAGHKVGNVILKIA